MARGLLVAFEGIDGSGKSTALAHVAHHLPGTEATREETEGPTGQWVRHSIEAGMEPLATTFLFMADRAQHVPWIEGRLRAGTHVLCDRFIHSTLAYQGVTLRGAVADPQAFLRGLHGPIGLWPDHVLLLRADPATAVDRTRARGGTTPYEKAAFLHEVQQMYLELADQDPRIHVLDADRPMAQVTQDALRVVRGWVDDAGPP